MRIMLIGSTGQLGSSLVEALAQDALVPLGHTDIEITDPASVRRAFERYRPEIVINTAAFHRVDDCERDVGKTFNVNAFAVRDLAIACREFDAALVQFSTDYVFSGDRQEPYRETDRPGPINVYGTSKLSGEYFVASILHRHFLIRTCGLYGLKGSQSKGGNFVETMLKKVGSGETVRVVDDQVVTPTYTREVARKVADLIRTDCYGLFHMTGQGQCSWYEFASKIFEVIGAKVDLRPVPSREFLTPARRPLYSVLENAKLQELGMDDLKPWDVVLREYFAERQQQGRSDIGPVMIGAS
jgi:dTDP-4-dehydrorhamnose reductase